MHALPIWRNGILESGDLVDAPPFCNEHADRNVCAKHYAVAPDGVVVACPYGFATLRTVGLSFGGLNVRGVTDPGLLPRKHRARDLGPKFRQDRVRRFCARPSADDVLHEVRLQNRTVKVQAERAKDRLDGREPAIGRALETILASAQLTSVRLNSYDFDANPELATASRSPRGVYKKFDKARYCLEALLGGKMPGFTFEGRSHAEIDTYGIFDLLPYVLLENAAKYLPPRSMLAEEKVHVSFDETPARVTVIVTSLGPGLDASERDTVFERGARGRYARRARDGSGLGLYLAKQIADLHGWSLKVYSTGDPQLLNDIPYRLFHVELLIPR